MEVISHSPHKDNDYIRMLTIKKYQEIPLIKLKRTLNEINNFRFDRIF